MKNVLNDDFQRIAESNLSFDEFRNRSFLIIGSTGLIGFLLVWTLLYCNHVHRLNLKV